MNNNKKLCDIQYKNIVNDILNNNEFNKMENIIHHGLDRKNHSLRVSYYSYKICKFLGLDSDAAARAGLLHDFFFEDNKNVNVKTRIETLINHPTYALENANNNFSLSEKEQDIIQTHMFPIAKKMPKYAESWLVDIVDDCVAIAEVGYNARNKVAYASNFVLLLLLTYFR